ncbi:MAG: hypothetical protein ACYC2G_12610 [Gemmatimonadaceae bacterium]
MHPSASFALGAALVLATLARPAVAQTAPAAPATTDHGAMQHGAMDHGDMKPGGGWPAMNEFHLLLMKTWHPASQSNDLAPTRTNAAAMAKTAEAWAGTPVPSTCGRTTGATVAGIASDARALDRLVAGSGTDAQVKEALGALHDRFESVEKGCSSAAPAGTPTPPAGR